MAIHSFSPLKRISYLQKKIVNADINTVLLNYSKSIFYYAGTTQPSILIITPEDCHLIVIRGFNFAIEETWLNADKLSLGRGYEDIKERLRKWEIYGGSLGMELDILPAYLYLKLSQMLAEFKIIDVSKLILEQRKIKDAKEIEYTKEACRIVNQGHQRILDVLHEGMTELELSSEIEDAHRKAGHEGLYFIRQFDYFMGRGPVASGENLSRIAGKVESISGVGLSPSIPMGASLKKIKGGEMIVVDIPTYCQGYHSDQSRTYVLGKSPESCKLLYRGMKEIADRIIQVLRPGIICDYLYSMAQESADELGMGPCFMRLGQNHKKVPFIGHGVGLELNEPPLLRKNNQEALQEGMIIALELEMTNSPHEAVKLEDTILITSEGAEILTITPRDLHEV
jgi:Xaa-Pro dipeptidase